MYTTDTVTDAQRREDKAKLYDLELKLDSLDGVLKDNDATIKNQYDEILRLRVENLDLKAKLSRSQPTGLERDDPFAGSETVMADDDDDQFSESSRRNGVQHITLDALFNH